MRISDWSSDVCSSDLSIRDQRVVEPFQNCRVVGSGKEEGFSKCLAGIYSLRLALRFSRRTRPVRSFVLSQRRIQLPYWPIIFFPKQCMSDRKSTRLNSSH